MNLGQPDGHRRRWDIHLDTVPPLTAIAIAGVAESLDNDATAELVGQSLDVPDRAAVSAALGWALSVRGTGGYADVDDINDEAPAEYRRGPHRSHQ